MGTCMDDMSQFLRLVQCIIPPPNHDYSPDIYVDFENAQPTETEAEVYHLVNKALEQAQEILRDLASYGTGATEAIRKAIGNNSDQEIQHSSWETLIPLVIRMREYYLFSQTLGQIIPLLLWELCSGPLPPVEQLDSRQALAKQFAKLLDFVLHFDRLKLKTPALQNDFSYYRRTMSKGSLAFGLTSNEEGQENVEAVVAFDEANVMSLFYAQPTPMLEKLKECTVLFVKEHPQLPLENTTDTLGTMANVCRVMTETPEFVQRFAKEEETIIFCLRVMVGAIILYDHVSVSGAFVKSSIINVKLAVKVLKNQESKFHEDVSCLLSTIKYHSKHLNDPTTPRDIKALFT